ncbi:rod shape-determining protein RodA [Saccharicrinis fermentans]|uniref:Cell wall polymerase n=1 Tax=Saccharicrinis fermentans DSM 9555 = JCM 21142 TaxID=869213 RepID=W7Y7I0_9BACT|nr:rod shape-determining protein RodA [Saccharicrinis fermentans]GAF04212.1 rod shape-determining protein RodA [Saccharicrinis fermentans DSM 9555 = JCM 21142]
MMRNNYDKKADWVTILIYIVLVAYGWFNIYAANYNPENPVFFDPGKEYAKQLIWIALSMIIIWIIFMTDSKFYVAFSYFLYGLSIFLLFTVIFVGKEINGAKSWFEIGPLRFQPAELAKIATALTLSRIMGRHEFSFGKTKELLKILGLWALPVLCIFLQNDTGSALVFFIFVLPFYREGLSGNILVFGLIAAVASVLTLVYPNIILLTLIVLGVWVFLFFQIDKKMALKGLLFVGGGFLLLLTVFYIAGLTLRWDLFALFGIVAFTVYLLLRSFAKKIKWIVPVVIFMWGAVGATFSADYFVNDVLTEYQRNRVYVLLGFKDDPLGAGYNVNQSKIAIGSGGLTGKGYLQGTQTKFDFVPEQSTDFIFCTVGEEWGYMGTFAVVFLFLFLILRLILLAEKQHSAFSRIYGYCVASIFFYHFTINIGMTIGLAPVIGIPLPFFSYGGSSLWGFTTLLFIFLKLDTNRAELIR